MTLKLAATVVFILAAINFVAGISGIEPGHEQIKMPALMEGH